MLRLHANVANVGSLQNSLLRMPAFWLLLLLINLLLNTSLISAFVCDQQWRFHQSSNNYKPLCLASKGIFNNGILKTSSFFLHFFFPSLHFNPHEESYLKWLLNTALGGQILLSSCHNLKNVINSKNSPCCFYRDFRLWHQFYCL